MKKPERLLRLFCNYIIANKIRLNDPDEPDCGQVVATIKLSEILKGSNIKFENLTIGEVLEFSSHLYDLEIYPDNKRKEDKRTGYYKNYYGTLFGVEMKIYDNDIIFDIWDGF